MVMSRLVPSMLGLLAAFPTLSMAATVSERDNHLDTVVALSDAGLLEPAKRQLDTWLAAGYEDRRGYYAAAVQWYYYNTFSLDVAGAEAQQYTAEAERFEKTLSGAGQDLPPELAGMYQSSGKIEKIANKIARDLVRPDSPPPLLELTDGEAKSIVSAVNMLFAAADEKLETQAKAIADYQSEVERSVGLPEGTEYYDIMREATMRRHAYMETLYQVYKPLREIILRKDESKYRFPPDLVDRAQRWMLDKIGTDKALEQLADWDYEFADYYPLLKGRIAVMRGEALRLSKVAGGANDGMSYEEVRDIFFAVTDLDLSPYDRETRAGLERLKYVVWSDMFYWHLLLGGDKLKQAERLWDDLVSRTQEDSEFAASSRDSVKQMLWGHLHILRARMASMAGDATGANGFLATVQASENPFRVNAEKWIGHFTGAGGSGAGGAWFGQPQAMDPEQALTVAKALISQANKVVDPKQIEGIYEQAAAALRDGVLGLPSPSSEAFVNTAPDLYYWLAYALQKRGWIDRAAVVAHAGLDRFQPDLWGDKPSDKNPWFPAGRLSKSGQMVRKLAQATLMYSQSFYARTRSDGANAMFEAAITKQGKFDPSAVEGNKEILQVQLLLEQGDLARARDKALKYYKQQRGVAKKEKDSEKKVQAMVNALKGLRYATRAQYQLWAELDDAGGSEDDIQEASDRLEKMAAGLNKFSMIGLKKKSPIPEAFRGDFRSAYQEVLNFTIGQLFKQERYEDVVRALDADFWASAPRDENLVRAFLGYLSGAVYQLNVGSAKQVQALKGEPREVITASVQPFLAQWPYYKQAYATFSQMIERYPAIDVQAESVRKRLAGMFNIVGTVVEKRVVSNLSALGKDAGGMLRTWVDAALPRNADGAIVADAWPGTAKSFKALDADGDGVIGADQITDAVLGAWLKAADPVLAAAADVDGDGSVGASDLDSAMATAEVAKTMERRAKANFADLYEPLINPDEKPNMILAVANTLWELDEKSRASKLFEQYKARMLSDPRIKAFQENPMPDIERIKALVAARQDTRADWERKTKGSIPDLLIDEPDFLEKHYLNSNSRRSGWPEAKADYFKALRAITEFQKKFKALELLIPNFAEAKAGLDDFEKLVRDLAYSVQIDTQLIEAYREAGDIGRAVEIATKLYEYDPLDPVFMVTMVEGSLEALRRGESIPQETITQARKIAAELRQQSKRSADMRNYWIASIQVLELSVYLNDFKTMNSILNGQVSRRILPIEDMYKPAGADFDPATIPNGYAIYRKLIGTPTDTGMEYSTEIVGSIDRTALQVIERYMQLFDEVDGIEIEQPLKRSQLEVPHPNGGMVTVPLFEVVADLKEAGAEEGK